MTQAELARQIRTGQHIPDILDCLAQLSNDEVPTPPRLARAMLDILPAHVWGETEYKWLDPACKSGVFLREIAVRLLDGLSDQLPDFEQRRDHIFRNMLYGTSITDLTGIISRRTVYYSHNAAGPKSVIHFDNNHGNIPFNRANHTFPKRRDGTVSGGCTVCGAPLELERGPDRENYAYSFIHGAYPTKEMTDMKFDVIVGNPPYQVGADGTNRDIPIYQHFVDRAIGLEPKYVAMIVMSRWFSGGLGLDDFRDRMINDRRLARIVDNPKVFDCFPGVKIRGGVNYFVWDRDHYGDCEFSTRIDGTVISTATRDLRNGQGVVIRDNQAATIVQRVHERVPESNTSRVQPRLAFGDMFRTNYRGSATSNIADAVPVIFNSGVGYVSRSEIRRGADLIERWKVLVPKASSGDTQQDESGRIVDVVLGAPIALAPGSICTETYFVVGAFDTRTEAENYANYLATKFVRFLVLQRKSTQDIRPEVFRFVPLLDMTRVWTDEDLYSHFGLTQEERDYIEASIKPRSVNLSLDSAIPTSHLPGGSKYKAKDAD